MTESHTHYWVLEPDTIENVPATCACGAKKTFAGGVPILGVAQFSPRGKTPNPDEIHESKRRGGRAGGAVIAQRYRDIE